MCTIVGEWGKTTRCQMVLLRIVQSTHRWKQFYRTMFSRMIEIPNIEFHEHWDTTVVAVSLFQYGVCYKRRGEAWSHAIAEWSQWLSSQRSGKVWATCAARPSVCWCRGLDLSGCSSPPLLLLSATLVLVLCDRSWYWQGAGIAQSV
jgi:hypothetical protein